jgi:periplasmic copper chaperone A
MKGICAILLTLSAGGPEHENGPNMRRVLFALMCVVLASGTPASFAQEDDSRWQKDDIVIEKPWARIVPGARTCVIYMVIKNQGSTPDKIKSVASENAASAAIHDSKMENGISSMRPLTQGIELPPGTSVEFRPTGMHIMVLGIDPALKPGGTIDLALTLDRAGEFHLSVPILPLASEGPE